MSRNRSRRFMSSSFYCSTVGFFTFLVTTLLPHACREEVLGSNLGIINSWRTLQDIGATAIGSRIFTSAEPHFSIYVDNCDPIWKGVTLRQLLSCKQRVAIRMPVEARYQCGLLNHQSPVPSWNFNSIMCVCA